MICAFCLRNVDLPAILGPVISHKCSFELNEQSLGTKAFRLFLKIVFSTTEWRPSLTMKSLLLSIKGRHQLCISAIKPRVEQTSKEAIFLDKIMISLLISITFWCNTSNIFISNSNALFLALKVVFSN